MEMIEIKAATLMCLLIVLSSVTSQEPVPRIFNGTLAKVGEFKSVVSITFYNWTVLKSWCTGAIISVNWVLTASHCVENYVIDKESGINILNFSATIKAGTANMSVDPTEANKVQVKKASHFYTHPKAYTPSELKHRSYSKHVFLEGVDIALLFIPEPFSFTTDAVQPIVLAKSRTGTDNIYVRNCFSVGFGRTEIYSTKHNDLLFHMDVNAVGGERCLNFTMQPWKKGFFSEYRTCNEQLGRTSICNGDSGSPLVCNVSGVQVSFGVSSYHSMRDKNDTRKCTPERSGVYIFPGIAEAWIQNMTSNAVKFQEYEPKSDAGGKAKTSRSTVVLPLTMIRIVLATMMLYV